MVPTMKKIQTQKWVMEGNYFPEDIIGTILSKLPVKDVIRCSAVCRSWYSLVRNPTLIQTHLKNQNTAGDLHLLASRQSTDLCWINPAGSFGQCFRLEHPFYNKRNISWGKDLQSEVVGTCNGVVCIAVSSFYIDPCPPVILWNPSIRKFGILPSPNRAVFYRYESIKFCYDSRIDDYKVVRIVTEPGCKIEVEVWSLTRGTWKSLSNVPADFAPFASDMAFVNGAHHWVQHHWTREEENPVVSVVALDMADESFRNVRIRQGSWRDFPPMISRYHGDGDQLWLTLFEIQGNSSFDLWVMKEYGVFDSWTKLFNVRLLGSPDEEPCIEPFGVTKSGQVVVKMGRDGELNSMQVYDPEDKQFRDFGNHGCSCYLMDSFVESLVLLDQTNVYSY
ncbi:F-box protein CPR1-like [Argentina anserina]|uniref:F-box protein CPR1-like n=1 Tax=Argentina anserina TaxID=57926 RepID=UPI00217674AD|nr:F-box protein CPR1-like [Potentilla anserina]